MRDVQKFQSLMTALSELYGKEVTQGLLGELINRNVYKFKWGTKPGRLPVAAKRAGTGTSKYLKSQWSREPNVRPLVFPM
jgi:hypothetical protein